MIAFLETLMKSALGLFFLLAAALPSRAADPAAGIRDAEKCWAQAVMALDFTALDRIYGDKLIYAHSTGAIQSKQEYLDRLQSGAQKYDTVVPRKNTDCPYGDSAVCHRSCA